MITGVPDVRQRLGKGDQARFVDAERVHAATEQDGAGAHLLRAVEPRHASAVPRRERQHDAIDSGGLPGTDVRADGPGNLAHAHEERQGATVSALGQRPPPAEQQHQDDEQRDQRNAHASL